MLKEIKKLNAAPHLLFTFGFLMLSFTASAQYSPYYKQKRIILKVFQTPLPTHVSNSYLPPKLLCFTFIKAR